MTIDMSINLPTLVTIVVSVVGVIAWALRLEGRVHAQDTVLAALRADIAALTKNLEVTAGMVAIQRDQLAAYKTEVAQTYMQQAVMGELRREIGEDIAQLERRIESNLDRLLSGPRSGRGQ